jgi:cystathionine gamma-lyase
MKFSTKAIHIGSEPNLKDGGSGDVIVPIHLSTTFARKNVYIPTAGYDYSRSGNPTRSALEKNLAALENANYAFAFSSGLAALTNVLLMFKPGDHIVSIDNVNGGNFSLFKQVFAQWGIEVSLVDFVTGDDIKKYIKPNTKLIFLESPTNPLMKIIDLASVAKVAKQQKILTLVDNTFASPYWQNPLDLGIDIVAHSATKYLGGHSDVTGGCVMVNDKELADKIGFLQNAVGSVLSPFDSYNLLKGIKTLELRMKQHELNASRVVEYLSKQKQVKKLYYPGLPSHPQHEIAKKQMKGFGAVLALELYGTVETAITFLESLKLFHIAINLGEVASLIEHPATMTHATMPKEEREKCGLSDTLIRLSVGIEDADDLIADLDQSLKKI